MDMAILMGIHSALGCPLLDAVMPFITRLGNLGAVWVVVTLVLLACKSTRRWGAVMLAALAIDLVCVEALKFTVSRPRPFMVDSNIQLLIPAPFGTSFPSGHTSSSFAAATVLLFAPLKKYWKVCGGILAVLIAFSRLYLCVHYPTDVLAGLLIGIAAALLAVWANKKIGTRGFGGKGPGKTSVDVRP